LVLSALSSSFWHALGLGVAYVLGMVFPLFLAALVWDRLGFARRPLRLPPIALTILGRQVRVRPTDLGAGILFVAMGLLMIGLALTGRATYTPDFLLAFNRWGSDRLATLASRLGWIPDWAVALGVLGLFLLIALLAWPRRRGVKSARSDHLVVPGATDPHAGHGAHTGHEGEAGSAAGTQASRSA
jgi:hypothetical protein